MGLDPHEGPRHDRSRKDAEAFHTQTEQRFRANNQTLPPEVHPEARHLLDSDLLVVHFSLWWFGLPAILKGWMDRVIVYGHVYCSAMRYDVGIWASRSISPRSSTVSAVFAFIEGHDGGLSTLDAYAQRWAEALARLPSRPFLAYNADGDFDETARLRSDTQVYSSAIRHVPDPIPR